MLQNKIVTDGRQIIKVTGYPDNGRLVGVVNKEIWRCRLWRRSERADLVIDCKPPEGYEKGPGDKQSVKRNDPLDPSGITSITLVVSLLESLF